MLTFIKKTFILFALIFLQVVNAQSLLLNKFEGIWNGNFNDVDQSKQNGTFVMDYKNSNGYLQAKNNLNLPIIFEGTLKFNLWDDNIQLQKGESIVHVYQYDKGQNNQIVKSCSLDYEVEFENSQIKKLNKINLRIHLYSKNDQQDLCYLDINLTGTLVFSSLFNQCMIVFIIFSLFYIIQLIGNKQMRQHIISNSRNAKKILISPFVINQIQNQAMISSLCYQLYILLQQIGFEETALLYIYIGCHIPLQFSDLFILNELLKAKYPSKFEQIMKLNLILYLLLIYVALMIQYGLLFVIEFYVGGNLLYELTLIITFVPQLVYNFKFYSIKLNPIIIFSIMGTKTFFVFYVRGCPYNILEQESSLLYFTLIGILIACQIALFALQYKKGPQSLIPKRFQQKVNLIFQLECIEICQICQEAIKDQQIDDNQNFSQFVNAGCGHYFHRECLKQYIQIQQECPLCKVELDI